MNHYARVSSVSTAIRCGLGGSGIEFRWGRDFPHLSTLALGPTRPSIQRCTWSFSWVKRVALGVGHPASASAEFEQRVELYLYYPLGHRVLF